MPDIIHRVGIKAEPGRVYDALATIEGLSGWWTRATTGDAKPGGTIIFRFHTTAGDEIGGCDTEVLETDPGRTVRWRVTVGPVEWLVRPAGSPDPLAASAHRTSCGSGVLASY